MPTFRRELPPEGQNTGFDLRRTPADGKILAIITCEELVVCDTHYWHGRTLPCERVVNDKGRTIDDTPCPACREKAAWRTHVYVSAFDHAKREHFLFECTAMAAKPLEEYRLGTGTLRGCVLHASRPRGLKNAKVAIQTNTSNLARNPIPTPPDIAAALAVIWRLPRTAIDGSKTAARERAEPDERLPSARRLRPKPDRLTEMRNQPDNEPEPPTMGEILTGNGEQLQTTVAK